MAGFQQQRQRAAELTASYFHQDYHPPGLRLLERGAFKLSLDSNPRPTFSVYLLAEDVPFYNYCFELPYTDDEEHWREPIQSELTAAEQWFEERRLQRVAEQLDLEKHERELEAERQRKEREQQ